MGRANFHQVVSDFNSAALGDFSAGLETLEILILDHTPTSTGEAVNMLDVIIPEVECGGRSDGRDVRALQSIRSYLASAAG